MNRILDIANTAIFNDAIIEEQYHCHTPYSSNSYNNNDEIRIPVHQQDVYTLPGKSSLLIEGKILKADGTDDTTTKLVNNAIAFLFDEIRYELCGSELDRIKNVGITTTIKNILTARPGDANLLGNAGWNMPTTADLSDKTSFSYVIPLKLLFGFADDYDRILLNVKQELVLLRASSDKNAIFQSAASLQDIKFSISKIIWRMPYVRVNDEVRLSLLRITNSDQPITLHLRRWELHERPSLPSSTFQTWTVKTSSFIEKPRYVIVGFQTDRKHKSDKIASHFDFCDLENVKLYLNSKYYPYENFNGCKSVLYDMYSRFQSSYYKGCDDQPCLDRDTFLEKTPLFVIDCSQQEETLKTGALDVRLEIQTKNNIPADTTAFCLIIHDAEVKYSPLSGIVRRIM